MKEEYPVYITAISSFIAGGISRSLVYPIDTIKTKLQVQQGHYKPQFLTISGAFKTTLTNEGIQGLYRGMSMSIIASLPANCIYYSTYEAAKQYLFQYNFPAFTIYFWSGMLAEAVSCALFVPIDVIKERLQVQSNLQEYSYKNSREALTIISKNEGIKGIYKAYGATVASFGPFSAIYFTLYENFKAWTVGSRKDIGIKESIGCAMAAGAISSWITNPLDMAKVRMQVVRATRGAAIQRFQYNSMFHGISIIYQVEGIKALFQGSLSRVLFHTPNTAISMGLVEYVRRIISIEE
ncbi:hypothetical protein SteCoe_33044 [Stentor coeruleus]|uniref:Mitochondrial carrier protein n=1 Tax=Stentor coeruleus TaxID=5963 RepID=A0A1R2AXK1_9CILI|nr:hypothetical protein SteCoe_33044 [Stentor coeruleus]